MVGCYIFMTKCMKLWRKKKLLSRAGVQQCNVKHYLGEMEVAQHALEASDSKDMYNKPREDEIINADKYEKMWTP
jgi:hypothetical protein